MFYIKYKCKKKKKKHELTSINKNPTCYKNTNNPICINHILTNNSKRFFKTEARLSDLLSDFHELVLSAFKLQFSKTKDKEILFRNFKDIKGDNFNQDLQNSLSAESVEKYSSFEYFLLDVLKNIHP